MEQSKARCRVRTPSRSRPHATGKSTRTTHASIMSKSRCSTSLGNRRGRSFTIHRIEPKSYHKQQRKIQIRLLWFGARERCIFLKRCVLTIQNHYKCLISQNIHLRTFRTNDFQRVEPWTRSEVHFGTTAVRRHILGPLSHTHRTLWIFRAQRFMRPARGAHTERSHTIQKHAARRLQCHLETGGADDLYVKTKISLGTKSWCHRWYLFSFQLYDIICISIWYHSIIS